MDIYIYMYIFDMISDICVFCFVFVCCCPSLSLTNAAEGKAAHVAMLVMEIFKQLLISYIGQWPLCCSLLLDDFHQP